MTSGRWSRGFIVYHPKSVCGIFNNQQFDSTRGVLTQHLYTVCGLGLEMFLSTLQFYLYLSQ